MAIRKCLLAAVATLALGPANAAVFEFGFAPLASWDLAGDPDNAVVSLDLASFLGFGAGTPLIIDMIGWDVTIETIGASWLSEASVDFQDSSGVALATLTPGVADGMPGVMSYSSGGLIDPGFLMELPDGILQLEFYESFDDVADDVDAFWSGTISVNARLVPIPAALPLMLSALALFGLVARRRA